MTTITLSLEALKPQFTGEFIAPADAAYDTARAVFPGGMDLKPAVIIRPADPSEVAKTIALARETGLPLSVKSGGHSGLGFGVVDGGIVLDLARFKSLDIDEKTQTAWAGTGLTAAEYTKKTHERKLATGFGDTGTVGLGGITLGGGIGYFVRTYGLTIDDVLAAEIVTADGRVRIADQKHDPDLFWAIRGGGGNFGVVTRFQYRLHPVDMVYGGMLVLPATAGSIAACVKFAQQAPNEFNAIFNVMTAPPMPFLPKEVVGKPIIMTMLAYIGDVGKGKSTADELKKIAIPLADMTRVMPYPDIYPPEQGGYHPMAAGRNMFIDAVDEAVAGEILHELQTSKAMMAVCQLRVLGGAMADVAPSATAFFHRKSKLMAHLAAVYQKPEEKDMHEAWVSVFAKNLRQKDTGSYVNFLGNEGEAGLHAAYPASTFKRLGQIKSVYDPENVFRSNWNIPSANTT